MNKRWSIILAGGDGAPSAPTRPELLTAAGPMPFRAPEGGSRTMLEHTIDRARFFSPTTRVVVSLCRDHRPWYGSLDAFVGLRTTLQAYNWGTGAAVLQAALEIDQLDPQATVAILHADHYVSNDLRFAAFVHQAASWVEENEDDVVVLGVRPRSLAVDIDWLLPLGTNPGHHGPRPARIVERPDPETALQLASDGGLWHTSVTIARVGALLRLMEVLATPWWAVFTQAAGGQRQLPCSRLQELGTLDLNRDILARAPKHTRGLEIHGCAWLRWTADGRFRELLPKLLPANNPPRLLAYARPE
jgi:mannose-1-phosphate guanylyltransferase